MNGDDPYVDDPYGDVITADKEIAIGLFATSTVITSTLLNPGDVVNMTVDIENIPLTASSGVAYGLNTGMRGVVCKFSITATDIDTNSITDFTNNNILLNFTLPNANSSSVLKIFKLNQDGGKMNPQPNNYPLDVNYVDPQNNSGLENQYVSSVPSLSNFAIIDNTPPDGASGGDPHIKPILDDKVILLPNEWELVKLYENDDYLVTAKAELVDENIIENMHIMNGTKVNVDKHKYVKTQTYFTEVTIHKNNEECLKVNMTNGELEYDNKKITWDKNNTKLYSLVHKKHYNNVNSTSYIVYLNKSNRVELTIDNYWDDLNSIELYLNDKKNIESYKGELIKHDISNCLNKTKKN